MISKKIVVYLISLATVGALADDTNTTKNENKIDLAPITVEAVRTKINILDYPGSIGVLDEGNLKQDSNIIDSIQDITGVSGGTDVGRQNARAFYVRGFGNGDAERVLVMQDGIPFISWIQKFGPPVSSLRTDNDILKSVEVAKGSSSILFGSGAIGGVINMQTKSASDYLEKDEQFGAMIGQRFESNHMRSTRGAVYGKGKDIPLDILIYGKKANYGTTKLADTYIDYYGNEHNHVFDDEDENTVFFKAGWDITDEQRLVFSIYDYDITTNGVWQSMSGIDKRDDFSTLSWTSEQRNYELAYKFNPEKYSWLNLSTKLYKGTAKQEVYDIYDGSVEENHYKDTRWGIKLKNNALFDTQQIHHNLVIGVDYAHREEKMTREYEGEISSDGYTPNEYKDIGFYVQDILSYEDFELILGGRYDVFNRDVLVNDEDEHSNAHFSPRIGLGYTLFDTITLLAGYSESFRAPTPEEIAIDFRNDRNVLIPNPDLDPETAKEYEFGFSVEKDGVFANSDLLTLKAMYFIGKIKDMINSEKVGETTNSEGETISIIQSKNVENARRKGYEIQAKYAINSWLFGASYEHLKLYDEDTNDDINAFADKLNINFNYEIISGLNLGLGINHWFRRNPSKMNDDSPAVENQVDGAFTQVNFKTSYDVKNTGIKILDNNMHINFGIKNLLDAKYTDAGDTNKWSSFNPGKGRNVYFDFEMNF